jgi:EmrB/QacA subfamily drug resistance transporter
MHPKSRTKRSFVIAAVMASMAMVAIEATIVSTAMPQIVSQLGDLHLYSWVFSSFLLTQTATTVIFGKLADIYGRKPVMLVGIAIFLVGSLLAGWAWSLPSLIVFRLLQGVGAGGMQPVALTIVGDLYPTHERGKVQGYLASVWAISAVLGPMVGGLLMRNFSWAWIFWINIPIGFLAVAGFVAFLHEEKQVRQVSVDVGGAVLFTIAVAALMISMTSAGTSSTREGLIALAVFVFSMIFFVLQERRAKDPMISFALWAHRPIAIANVCAVGVGMVLMGLTTFLPMYVQGVLYRSPVVAGLALTMIMVGWPLGATFTARSFQRFGLRRLMIVGSMILPLGAIVFVMLGQNSSPVVAALGSFVMGFGMGLVSISALVLIQEIVAIAERGSATASNIFSRNLGSTLGTTLFGAVLNYGLTHTTRSLPVSTEQLRDALDRAPGSVVTAADAVVRDVLQHSLHLTFLSMLCITVLIVLLAVGLPPIVKGSLAHRGEPKIAEG